MASQPKPQPRLAKPFASFEELVFLEIQRTAQVSQRWCLEALKPSGLTPTQFNVLRILRGARPAGLSSSGIAERMVQHDPDLTRLLDRLEKVGAIAKSRDTGDRRVVNVRITPEGVKQVEAASACVRKRLAGALGPLGKRRLDLLADLLKQARLGSA